MSVAALVAGNPAAAPDKGGIIKLAILAVGGQGGGVLTNWILDVAEANGYVAQSTSVPGVAQRTGATIYYIEMLPESDRQPVFALLPSPGDVDIVVAAELMEAGRSVTRGLVSADRTTLIASSHRMYAVSEKVVPGDGKVDGGLVLEALSKTAKKVVCHDLAAIAERHGAHISASLFGALAGSGALPFARAQFEKTIHASGRGVDASLKAFGEACDLASGAIVEATARSGSGDSSIVSKQPVGSDLKAEWQALASRIEMVPEPARDMARAGLRKVVDYQDLAYGEEYLRHLQAAVVKDRENDGARHDFAFATAMAKHLANAMCYDDVIRVADLKTRAGRTRRVRDDVEATDDMVVHVTEYMHPRVEEVIGTMPPALAGFVERRKWLRGFIAARCRKGRRWRSDALVPFLLLYSLGGLRRWRRALCRHQVEVAHRDAWLEKATGYLDRNYALAVEVVNARRLIKGYSDTHARGLSKFDRVLDAIVLIEQREDAADWARRLMTAALAKESNEALDGAIQTIKSFCDSESPAAASVV
ncbi:MAG: indolepyruvate oxidoreductase subunit beta family protein [Hyphomicrobiaceae bacterium]